MIKTRLLSIFLTLALVSTLLLSNTFAQDYLQWELPDGAIARIGKGGVGDIQYSPDGRFLAVSNRIGIWLYDTATLQEAAFLTGDTNGIICMAFSPDGRTFAIGIGDGTIQIWDTIIGARKTTLVGHTNGIFGTAFSPDGNTIVSGSSDGTVRLWDVNTGIEKKTLTGHTDWVWSVAFSPDGDIIASGDSDGSIYLWDANTGAHTKTLTGHTRYILSLAFSPDGRILVSGGEDNTVRLYKHRGSQENVGNSLTLAVRVETSREFGERWRRRTYGKYSDTGKHKNTLPGHTSGRSVAFSPDSRWYSTNVSRITGIWLALRYDSNIRLQEITTPGIPSFSYRTIRMGLPTYR